MENESEYIRSQISEKGVLTIDVIWEFPSKPTMKYLILLFLIVLLCSESVWAGRKERRARRKARRAARKARRKERRAWRKQRRAEKRAWRKRRRAEKRAWRKKRRAEKRARRRGKVLDDAELTDDSDYDSYVQSAAGMIEVDATYPTDTYMTIGNQNETDYGYIENSMGNLIDDSCDSDDDESYDMIV